MLYHFNLKMETAFLDPHLWIIYIFIIYSPLLKVYIQGILFCQKISIWRIPKYASVLAQLFLKKEMQKWLDQNCVSHIHQTHYDISIGRCLKKIFIMIEYFKRSDSCHTVIPKIINYCIKNFMTAKSPWLDTKQLF